MWSFVNIISRVPRIGCSVVYLWKSTLLEIFMFIRKKVKWQGMNQHIVLTNVNTSNGINVSFVREKLRGWCYTCPRPFNVHDTKLVLGLSRCECVNLPPFQPNVLPCNRGILMIDMKGGGEQVFTHLRGCHLSPPSTELSRRSDGFNVSPISIINKASLWHMHGKPRLFACNIAL